jgi:hypothetical protein
MFLQATYGHILQGVLSVMIYLSAKSASLLHKTTSSLSEDKIRSDEVKDVS